MTLRTLAAVELGLMVFSVLVAVAGIALAWQFYVVKPEISERLAERFAGAHRTLTNKYYVDELYEATVISGTMASAPRPVVGSIAASSTAP